MFAHALALIAAQLTTAEPPPVTPADVMAMFDRVPKCELCTDTWHWSKKPDAPAIARAIAKYAPTRFAAALGAVYAVREGELNPHARGDFDKTGHPAALGSFQEHLVPPQCAYDPDCSVRIWYALKDQNEALCRGNDEPERLAALASGSCDRGKRKTRHRWEVARQVAHE
jgi:hypothetical protein